jgi:hypothetical protein
MSYIYNINNMKSKKSSYTFSGSGLDLLHNKYVLYISFFFAIVTAARYLLGNNLEAIGIFVIIGFLTTYFSKNMIIVLLTTTILTNFIVMVQNRRYSTIEGMETKTGSPLINNKTGGGVSRHSTGGTGTGTGTGNSNTSNGSLSATHQGSAASISSANQPPTKKETMSQLTPATVGAEADDPMIALNPSVMASGSDAQKEQALNALSGLTGGGNNAQIQADMINNLKTIEPILKTAENFLDKFENSSISKMFANMGNIPGMSLLTGSGAAKSSPSPVGAES